MSVEEQLERMRRNQEASSLREKKRETPSRSPSFSKDNPAIIQQGRGQMEGACADPVQLEAALQQLKVETMEQSRTHPSPEEVQGVEECEEVQQDGEGPLQGEEELQDELCVSQRVVIVDLCAKPQRVEIVNPFEDDESREQDLTSSPTNTTTENRYYLEDTQMLRT
ncbi:pleckstrin homology domain-containing family A member 5-like [Notothenia coriiceps]|uniref:Pleckstrin homology domain-containing family A member 5-like n=1 Tax=Notothenia coriiceps TaxID=8208 RepID=A0A6I9NGS2_9TELE|nr:PREDICTED: pleckstrin homology domain-containing family A member 5-like [Notothenia coriiceps]